MLTFRDAIDRLPPRPRYQLEIAIVLRQRRDTPSRASRSRSRRIRQAGFAASLFVGKRGFAIAGKREGWNFTWRAPRRGGEGGWIIIEPGVKRVARCRGENLTLLRDIYIGACRSAGRSRVLFQP